MWTIIREVIFTVTATYTFGIVLGWGLVGIWTGLATGRILASILNFTFARYTIKKVREKFGT
jgi:Na+-driven multidrug efflux pump